jgi:hypothetical protein
MRFLGYALGSLATVAMLAGCAGSSGQVMTPQEPVQSAASISGGDLLYIAHIDGEAKHESHGIVSILTFPQGKPVATISGFEPWGMCSDTSGNVWVAAFTPKTRALYEFAHGGTKPIAKIRMTKRSFPVDCAVDPTTGNLAVTNLAGHDSYSGSIDVWAGAKPGKPAVYRVPFIPQYAAYDDGGNLFFDGYPGGSDTWLVFGELARGSNAVAKVRIDKRVYWPGGVQWDGKYIAVETGGAFRFLPGRIYRVETSGSVGKVIGVVYPTDPTLYFDEFDVAQFCLDGHKMVSMAGPKGGRIELWRYPAGGSGTQFIGRFNSVRGMTISVAR